MSVMMSIQVRGEGSVDTIVQREFEQKMVEVFSPGVKYGGGIYYTYAKGGLGACIICRKEWAISCAA